MESKIDFSDWPTFIHIKKHGFEDVRNGRQDFRTVQNVKYWQEHFGFDSYILGFISGEHHMNPYPVGSKEFQEWTHGRIAAINERRKLKIQWPRHY